MPPQGRLPRRRQPETGTPSLWVPQSTAIGQRTKEPEAVIKTIQSKQFVWAKLIEAVLPDKQGSKMPSVPTALTD